jgi:membrane-associated phospholipid phosphatase
MLLRRLEVSVAAALAAAFAILAVLTTVPAVAAWDLRIDVAVNALVATDSALLTVGFAVTAVGSPVVVDVLTAIAVIAVGVRGDRAWRAWRARAAPYLAAARLVELGVETGLKHLADRHRPLLPHPLATRPGRSFPSGHTAAP